MTTPELFTPSEPGRVVPLLPATPASTCATGRVVAVVAAGLLVGAAAGIAGALAFEGLARRVRVLADELADVFPDGWLR